MRSLLERERATGRQVDRQENQWRDRWGWCVHVIRQRAGQAGAGGGECQGESNWWPVWTHPVEFLFFRPSTVQPEWKHASVGGLWSPRQTKIILSWHHRAGAERGQEISVYVWDITFLNMTDFQAKRRTTSKSSGKTDVIISRAQPIEDSLSWFHYFPL